VLSSYDVECEMLSCISQPVRFLETCHMFMQSDMVCVTLCKCRYVNNVLDIFLIYYTVVNVVLDCSLLMGGYRG
jgi:hypothetical protein